MKFLIQNLVIGIPIRPSTILTKAPISANREYKEVIS